MEWQSIYTLKDIASCIEKIQPVRYNERMSLFSTLDVMAYSSGYSLGSSNWLIETSMKKIVVLSSSSSRPELHPALLDHTLIHSADVILVSGVSLDDHPTPTFERQVKKCLSHIAGTLGARHNVILPISITGGLVYDLIWMIDSHLRTLGMELGHESHQIPMYMISPMAEQSLQYANICGEWMTNECQEQLWVPNMPLPHGGLMKSGALTTFTTMASIPLSKTKNLLSSPCLVFTGDHQVLSHGALDWFMQNWGTDSNNLCLFTDSNMSDEQLQQYDKVDMAIMHLPLDTRLTMKQVLDWIRLYWKTITTKHLILPRTAATTSLLHGDSFGLNNVHTQLYSSGEMIDINLGFEWEHISISSQLARDIKPVQVPWMTMTNETKQMAHISGDLQVYNNQLILHRMTSHLNTNLVLLSSSTHTHSLDSISVSDLRNKLHKVINLLGYFKLYY
ncbi:beta-lactamase-like protein [Chlamydoabsidia padenii]|nr:beta-lactamase-like protein [Chlamydoabsidia padenii]